MSIIKINNLVKSFNGKKILNNISISIDACQIVSIIGPSGSGKTTLLRSINMLEIPDSGYIKIGNITVNASLAKTTQKKNLYNLRKKIGFVFQNFNLFSHRSVLENIIEGPVIVKKEKKEKAISYARFLLKKVGLESKENVYPRHLSGGQQQRVAIIRAIAMHPEVILLDEPTSALDPELISEVLDVIVSIAQEQNTIMIIVTHEMSVARKISNTSIFIDNGCIIEYGPTEELFNNPQQERTIQFFKNIS